jgi:hypothetical protein
VRMNYLVTVVLTNYFSVSRSRRHQSDLCPGPPLHPNRPYDRLRYVPRETSRPASTPPPSCICLTTSRGTARILYCHFTFGHEPIFPQALAGEHSPGARIFRSNSRSPLVPGPSECLYCAGIRPSGSPFSGATGEASLSQGTELGRDRSWQPARSLSAEDQKSGRFDGTPFRRGKRSAQSSSCRRT